MPPNCRERIILPLLRYRDIPTRTLDLHRVQCFFAQDSCLLLQAGCLSLHAHWAKHVMGLPLQAAPAKPPTADDNLSPTHAEVHVQLLPRLS